MAFEGALRRYKKVDVGLLTSSIVSVLRAEGVYLGHLKLEPTIAA